jgi:hypothetical protein
MYILAGPQPSWSPQPASAPGGYMDTGPQGYDVLGSEAGGYGQGSSQGSFTEAAEAQRLSEGQWGVCVVGPIWG